MYQITIRSSTWAESVLIEENKEKELKHSDVFNECNLEGIKPVMAGAAISGLFVIFQDNEFFRVKNIPDTREARQLISEMGLVLNDTVEIVKTQARSSLARSDRRSNIV